MRRQVILGFTLVAVSAVGFSTVVTVARYLRPVPAPQLSLAAPAQLTLDPGVAPPLPTPQDGSLALESDLAGSLASVAADQVRPIASVAKTMTALVVLEARPLGAGGFGPAYVMTANDVALYEQAVRLNGSVVPVSVGERFTERQMLLALMLPSANNLAETLAIWLDASRDAFVARLNARARALGMSHTHFDDPSGYSPNTVSTAADLVRLGKAVLANSDLAVIVATRTVDLPDGTTQVNLDSDLASQPGWLGIKTGWTSVAGGCLLFAAERTPPGATSPVRVIGAILGQPGLGAALDGAARVAETALAGYDSVDLTKLSPGVAGTVSTPWGDSSDIAVSLAGGSRLTVTKGAAAQVATSSLSLSAPLAANSVVATVTARMAGNVVATWQLTTTAAVGEPSIGWRITH